MKFFLNFLLQIFRFFLHKIFLFVNKLILTQKRYTKPENFSASQLDEKLQNDLRRSHFKFDDVKNNNFQTTFQRAYKENGGNIPPLLDENARRNLRNTHYTLGQDTGKYSTEYYTKYTKKEMQENVNMRELSSQLRATHFKLG